MKRTRRTRLVASVLALVVGLALAGCTASQSPAPGDQAATGSIQGGGTLRVGILASPTDTLDPAQATTPLPHSVIFNVFDSLVLLTGGEFTYQLAESIEPNADATEWTIRIRGGVKFHDGRDLTADDVLASLTHISESPNYASLWMGVDWDASTSDGAQTVTVVFTEPKAAFVGDTLARGSAVHPAGYTRVDFAQPVGSGPFKLESFSADTGAVLVRNDDYWGEKAHLERIELMPMADPASRISALEGRQIDYASGITVTGAETLRKNDELTVNNLGIENSDLFFFSMNATKPPFDDPEVREAFRTLVDRQQLVDIVFRGEGVIGNDLVGMGLPGYNGALPQREHDPDAAKQVLEEKGVTEVEILASETTPGILAATELLQQQLADAGVTLKITEADPANVYHDMQAIYDAQMFANYYVSVPFVSSISVMTGTSAPFNFSQWSTPEYDALKQQSFALVDPAANQTVLDDMQEMLWNEGGDILWGYLPALSGSVSNVTGVTMTQNVPLFAGAGYTD